MSTKTVKRSTPGVSRQSKANSPTASKKPLPSDSDSSHGESISRRTDYCGECCLPIDISNPKEPRHIHNGMPLCSAKKPVLHSGPAIDFPVDTKTRDAIEASGLDPRDFKNWLWHPAADGNKGYRTWRGNG